VKTTRGNDALPVGRVRSSVNARDEIDDTSRSVVDLRDLSPSSRRKQSLSDGFLYSYDRADSPAHVLSLDVFVKPPNVREMEKLVEREYEILDANGDALKGRKARQTLRQTASGPVEKSATAPAMLDDDDFELV